MHFGDNFTFSKCLYDIYTVFECTVLNKERKKEKERKKKDRKKGFCRPFSHCSKILNVA